MNLEKQNKLLRAENAKYTAIMETVRSKLKEAEANQQKSLAKIMKLTDYKEKLEKIISNSKKKTESFVNSVGKLIIEGIIGIEYYPSKLIEEMQLNVLKKGVVEIQKENTIKTKSISSKRKKVNFPVI